MSYGDKYKFEYRDQPLGRLTTVIISENGFTGDVEWIKGGGDPVQIESKSDNNYILNQIYGSECTLNIISETSMKFVDLFNSNAFKYKVTIWKEPEPDESQIVWWVGYLLPDEYSEPLDFYINYEVSLRARDVLGGLKTTDFLNDNGQKYVGKAKVIKIIADCLKKTGLNLFINFSVNLEEVNFPGTIDPLDNIYIDYEAFYLEKIPTCEYVLKQILQSFGARIIMNTGSWWIQRVALFRSQHTVYAYDADGNYIYNFLYNPSKTYTGNKNVTNNRLYFTNKKGQLEINPAFKEFKINQDYGTKASFIKNYKFDDLIFNTYTSGGITYTELVTITNWNKQGDFSYYYWPAGFQPASNQTYDKGIGFINMSAGEWMYSDGVYIEVGADSVLTVTITVSSARNGNLNFQCLIGNTYYECSNFDGGVANPRNYEVTNTVNYPVANYGNEVLNDKISFRIEQANEGYFKLKFNTDFINIFIGSITTAFGSQTDQYPKNIEYNVLVDSSNNEKGDDVSSILGDLPLVNNNEDVYIRGYWGFNGIDFIPTYSWIVLGTERQLSLMEVLADLILDQHLRSKQQITAELQGNFDFNHTIIIPFMGNKMYLPIRISLSDKYCKFDVEMIELLETDGEGGKVLATNLLEPIATNNDQLIKIT